MPLREDAPSLLTDKETEAHRIGTEVAMSVLASFGAEALPAGASAHPMSLSCLMSLWPVDR